LQRLSAAVFTSVTDRSDRLYDRLQASVALGQLREFARETGVLCGIRVRMAVRMMAPGQNAERLAQLGSGEIAVEVCAERDQLAQRPSLARPIVDLGPGFYRLVNRFQDRRCRPARRGARAAMSSIT
jgi:hypothetical protein